MIFSGTLEHSRLNEVGFDNMAQSVGPCDINRIEREGNIKTTNNVISKLVLVLKTCVSAFIRIRNLHMHNANKCWTISESLETKKEGASERK